MSYLRYADRMYNAPLLITSAKARVLEQVIRAHEEGRATLLSPPAAQMPRRELSIPGMSRADGGYLRTGSGVAIVQMVGTFVQRAGDEQLDSMSGLLAYSTLARQITAAADDPRVDAILAEVDSDGGESAGIVDFVAAMRAAGQIKPIWGVAAEKAFSAGMWVLSAASKVFVPRTGMVGSIGVRMLHVDQSQRDAKQGLVYTEIIAGERKADFSPHMPLTDAALATAQEMVDNIYGLFVAAVAEHRGIDQQIVRDTQAGLLGPAAALRLGLIDGIQSFEETLAQLTAEGQHVRIHGMRASAKQPVPTPTLAANEGDTTMDTKDTAATAATGQPPVDQAKLQADARTAERARINAIITHVEAAGRGKLAQHLAMETDMTPETAGKLLAVSAKEQAEVAAGNALGAPANLLAAAMGKVPNPQVGAEASGGEEETEATVAARIAGYAKHVKFKAVK